MSTPESSDPYDAETRAVGRGEDVSRRSTVTVMPPRIGRYRIERQLGRGGFGVVYLAHDEQLNRPVAIKVAHPDLIANEADAEMYLAEARIAASLDHPGTVKVYDVGETASDVALRGRGTRREDRRCIASRPQDRFGPSRRQTGEHPDRRKRQAFPGGFWACPSR